MLSGDNGILQKATAAKEQTGIGQEKEIVTLAYNSALAKKVGNGDSTEVTAGNLNAELTNQGASASGNAPIIITFENGHMYSIANNGKIEEYTPPQPSPAKDVVQIGDYVDYSAGIWTSNEINSLTDNELYDSGHYDDYGNNLDDEDGDSAKVFAFNGFSTSSSKDSGVSTNSGWRVLKIENDIITLIHASCPERFMYNTDGSDASLPFKAEYILKGSTNSDTYTASYFENQNIRKRDWSMYENNLAIDGSARCVTYDEINTISTTNNLRAIGMNYWLPKCGIGIYRQ